MNQILIAVLFLVIFALAGYFLGTWLQSRPGWYKPVFIGIVVVGAAALAMALIAGLDAGVAAAIGSGFGLLNGVRHGFTRPFEGLTPGSDEERRA